MRKTATPRPRQAMGSGTSSRSLGKALGAWLSGSICAAACFGGLALLAPAEASAQEILLTGPLKGAGSVHDLRLYRKGRFEIAPAASFTLLDEYMRQVLAGARINYNLTDFLAIGAWGGISPSALKFPAGLVDKIQTVSEQRQQDNKDRLSQNPPQQPDLQNRLTALNLGNNFEDQLGSIDWIVAPQVTFVPFRGKIALFQSIYIDSDLYFFAGPALVGVKERADCAGVTSITQGGCSSSIPSGVQDAEGVDIVIPNAGAYPMASRVAIAPTFGLGFTFYINKWAGLGFEWRATPFSRNTGGFDNHGTGPDNDFPDNSVNSDDRDLKLNQMLSVSFNVYLPFEYQVSE